MNLKTILKRWRGDRIFRMSARNSKLFLWRNRHCYWPELGSIEHFASEYSQGTPGLTFIQAGSGDGILGDPIHRIIKRDGWRGIVLEPLTDVYSNTIEPLYRLQPGVTTLNAAIGGDDKEKNESGRNGSSGKETAGSVTVTSLISGHGIAKIDWLQMDSGEAVVKTIGLFDGAGLKPAVVVYGNPMKKESGDESKKLLVERGYLVKDFGSRTLAALEPDEYLSRFFAE